MYGLPVVEEVRVSAPVSRPVEMGVNRTASQQLKHVPDALVVKAVLGGWPCP